MWKVSYFLSKGLEEGVTVGWDLLMKVRREGISFIFCELEDRNLMFFNIVSMVIIITNKCLDIFMKIQKKIGGKLSFFPFIGTMHAYLFSYFDSHLFT